MVVEWFEPESTTLLVKVGEDAGIMVKESFRAGTLIVWHDQVESMQWQNLNVFNKEWVIVSALPQGDITMTARCTVSTHRARGSSRTSLRSSSPSHCLIA